MNNNFFRAGSYYFICDVCGEKHHKEDMRIRWDNMVVCPKDYEVRHPQDFLRAREDRQSVPISRPRPTDSFVPIAFTAYPTDSVGLLDSIVYAMHYVRSLSDTATLSDSLNIGFGTTLSDTTTLTDSIVTHFKTTLSDSTTMTDLLSALLIRILNDTVTVTDTLNVGHSINVYTINGNQINEETLG